MRRLLPQLYVNLAIDRSDKVRAEPPQLKSSSVKELAPEEARPRGLIAARRQQACSTQRLRVMRDRRCSSGLAPTVSSRSSARFSQAAAFFDRTNETTTWSSALAAKKLGRDRRCLAICLSSLSLRCRSPEAASPHHSDPTPANPCLARRPPRSWSGSGLGPRIRPLQTDRWIRNSIGWLPELDLDLTLRTNGSVFG